MNVLCSLTLTCIRVVCLIRASGSHSTLQDIKVSEKAGGYAYKDASKYFTRNRFICWHIGHNFLELVEHSFDLTLIHNRIKYKLSDTPLLESISIHETNDSVMILMVTLSSVLKLSFPHPRTVCKEDPVSTVTMNVQSIFSEALIQTQSAPYMFHLIPSAGLTNSLMPHTATSWMSNNEALFALAYSTGTILILRLNVRSGQMHSSEIKQESIVPRFLSGIATAFRGRSADTDVSMSLVMHSWNHNFYLFSLSREGRLRMWSYVKSQCIADIEVIPNNYSSDHPIQNFGLKKFCDSVDDLYLCTYLKLNSKCEFCILKLVDENEVLSLVKISTLFSTEHHLIDFSFTNTRLWAVWKTTEFHRSVVKHATIPKKYERLECVWESAILEQICDTDCVSTDPSIDPRQAYINHIFKPGNFSLLDITKALNVYQKQNSFNELVLSSLELKEKVCLAVESEIQAEIMDYELTDEDYLECVNRCWSKFYSCVQQYHENGSRPVGVLLLPEVHGIILLKKTSFSLLRPMETLEQLMLCNSKTHLARFKTVPGFLEDDSQYQGVMTLLSALITIEEHLTDNFRYHFKKELHQLNSPDVVIERFLAESVVETNCRIPGLDFQSEIFEIIDNIQDLANATGILIRLLTYDSLQNRKSNMHKKDDECPRTLSNVDYYFKSQLGVSVISKTVSQINLIRYSLCRNLLILQQIILCRSELFDSQTFSWIRSNAAPKAVVLMQAYHVVMWICECEIISSLPPNFLESSLQRLSILRRSQELNITKQYRPYSLLESFIQYIVKDGSCMMSGFHFKTFSNIYWHIGMLECVNLVSKLIWPISEDFHFPEWLLFSCQFPLVQEYIRILGTWCEWNGTSRKFILAMSFLEMGETQKACDIFLRAFSGVISEKYILELLVTDRKISKNDAVDHYFLTVIKMFEQFNASDCITTLAMNALTLAEKYNQNLPTYYSIIFTQHLGLQHYTEAYNYLNTNPDIARRVDCLRQLVVTLFNCKKLLDLLAFPYVDMYQDLERIIQDRGRSTEVTANSYYDFLYGFHINTGNMRKAASTMYEQAVRLGQEPPVLSFLLRQARCYLAAMNALQLVDNDYRWIVRPFFKRNCVDKDCCWTNKKILDSNEILRYKIVNHLEILEVNDIKKEYLLCEAQLKIVQLNSDICTSAQPNPSEIITVLSRVGLFSNALDICESFDLDKTFVLETLAAECARSYRYNNLKSWDWLYPNDISDLSLLTTSPPNLAWNLLQSLMEKYEKKDKSSLHKGVARRLYQMGSFIPSWLFQSYAKRNVTELLRLKLQMGRLEEATDLSLDYIQTLLSGKGHECFGLSSTLLSKSSSVCFPYSIIEVLLSQLQQASKKEESYCQMYHSLQNALKNYLRTVKQVSENVVAIKNGRS